VGSQSSDGGHTSGIVRVRTSGIVLAAGSGTRMGQPKAELIVDGVRLVDRAVQTLRDGGCDEVIVVTRAGVDVPGARTVLNPDPDRGMGSSLVLGLQAATGERAVILLVDTPGITSAAVRRVRDADGEVAIGTYAGRRGHPVRIERRWWPDVIARAVADQGARGFLRAHPELVVEVVCEGDPSDLDTAADLAAWVQRPS